MNFNPDDFKHYRITGRLFLNNKPFAQTITHARHAMGINLYNGRVWGVRRDGTRKLLKHVVN